MKKLIILVAITLITISGFCQSYFQQTVYNNSTAGNKYQTSVNVIGNPARGAIIFRLSNPNNTHYNITLYSTTGQRITSIDYNHPGGVSTQTMYVPEGVSGLFYLVLLSHDEKQTVKLFIQ